MTINRRKVILGIGIALAIVASCSGVFVAMTWPLAIASQERMLTGRDFELELIAQVDNGSYRDGSRAWVYRIPPSVAAALKADLPRLTAHPMWSALAFDGYRRVHWQSLQEIMASEHKLLAERVFVDEVLQLAPESVRSVEDVCRLASSVSKGQSTLISGWYTSRDDMVTNYFVYVIDFERCLLIKLSWLT